MPAPLAGARVADVGIARPPADGPAAREPAAKRPLEPREAVEVEQPPEDGRLVAEDLLVAEGGDAGVLRRPAGHGLEMQPAELELRQQAVLLGQRLEIGREREPRAAQPLGHHAVGEVPVLGGGRLDAGPGLGATPMVEVARDHQVARIPDEARDAETPQPLEIQGPVVDRGDAVPVEPGVELLEVAVEVAIAAAPRQTAVEDRVHDPPEVDRQALVVRAVDEMDAPGGRSSAALPHRRGESGAPLGRHFHRDACYLQRRRPERRPARLDPGSVDPLPSTVR